MEASIILYSNVVPVSQLQTKHFSRAKPVHHNVLWMWLQLYSTFPACCWYLHPGESSFAVHTAHPTNVFFTGKLFVNNVTMKCPVLCLYCCHAFPECFLAAVYEFLCLLFKSNNSNLNFGDWNCGT